MDQEEFSARSAGLIARVKGILLDPKKEWPIIEAEGGSIAGIFTSYVVPLAAIGPIAYFLGSQIFGINLIFITVHPGLAESLGTALFSLAAGLVAVYVIGKVFELLGPSFDAQPTGLSAFKLAAYSMTAGWVAGVALFFPTLAMIGWLFGLYGYYILYLGLPSMTKVPEDKRAAYAIVAIIVAIVVQMVFIYIAHQISGSLFSPSLSSISSNFPH